MGAKLSKKKKGYCLGAGKDGESTDTTEVEQKETENQEGQKDAAEPKGEKTPTDQSQNNGLSEEPKDRKSFAEVTTGEATKAESNQDQNPEIKPSAEQEKVKEKDPTQEKKKPDEGKLAASDKVCDKEKGKNEAKTETECEVKETLAVATDKPTQESKLVKETEGSDYKQSPSETKQLAPVQDEVAVKKVSESVTKVEAELTKRAPTPVGTEDQDSEKASEVPTQANKSVVEPEKLEKVPEKVEPSAPESVTVAPVLEAVVEAVVSQPVIKIELVEPEVDESAFSKPDQLTEEAKHETAAVPEKVDSALPNYDPTSEPVHSSLPEPVEPATKEPELAPEPEPSQLPEPVAEPTLTGAVPEIKLETADPEKPTANLEQNVLTERDPEPVPCPASEKISDTKQELTSGPLPPISTEVPDETADAQEPTENHESLGCCDQGADSVTIQSPTIEADSIKLSSEVSEQHAAPLIQNGPSEISAEDDYAEEHLISTKLKVEDKGEQKEAVESTGDLDKTSTQQDSQVVKEDCKPPIDGLLISKNENDTKETHDASQHCNSEDKTENHDISAEVKNENKPPAPEILEKHGVGNGLPIKEEIKVHLENKCDNDLHDLNEQSQEIQVCNE
ncbi:uncharacterized protein ACMZJ9_016917 isoform 1-T5 [Mantella aurantiaca]